MYECHVTIEPVFGTELNFVENVANGYNFKVANLLMQKRREDSPERSKNDTFMTGHDKDFNNIKERLENLITDLTRYGYKVWRYKIEDIIVDSRFDDEFNFLK